MYMPYIRSLESSQVNMNAGDEVIGYETQNRYGLEDHPFLADIKKDPVSYTHLTLPTILLV